VQRLWMVPRLRGDDTHKEAYLQDEALVKLAYSVPHDVVLRI